MSTRTLMVCVFLLQTNCVGIVRAQTRSTEGTYRNPAEGYSIKIPRGLKGVTGDQSGPERGVRISLPSGGEIVVFGEPNSFEYKSPEDGIRDELRLKDCEFARPQIQPAAVGKLKGARGTLVCGDSVLSLFLALRPRGGPIYWLRLETTRAHESEDQAVLQTIAASFKPIPWK